VVACEERHAGRVDAEQLPRVGASEAESSTCASACCATASRTSCRPHSSCRSSETHGTTGTTDQDSGAISYRKCLREACIRVSRNGPVQWHRGTVEEDTRCVGRDDPSNFATDEHSGDEAAASGSPSWKETGTTSACSLQACGPETTRTAARSDGFETSAGTDCTATGCCQA
jgi:hypothetical protein